MQKNPLESLGKMYKKQAIEAFERFKNGYSENIPEGVSLQDFLRDKNKSDMFKRGESFFNRLTAAVPTLIGRKLIKSPEGVKHCKEFQEFVTELKKEKSDRDEFASDEDVAEADKFIDYILGELQK